MKRLKKEMTRVMDEATSRGETPCVLALLWRNDEEKAYCASGYSDLGRADPISRDAIFRLYSLTKPMTAVAAMTLVERGVLDIAALVSEFLPGFADQQVAVDDTTTVPVKRPMMVRDLFSMTSGLCYPGETTPAERATAKLFDAFDAETTAGNQPDTITMCNRIGALPLAFHPGEGWQYGLSADVLGAVVEVASGKPFDEYLAEIIFEPLGMKDTSFFVPPEKQARVVTLYEHKDGMLSPCPGNSFGVSYQQERPHFISGGAGLLGTLDDTLRFARMLLGKGTLNGERILSARSVEWLTGNHLDAKMLDHLPFASLLGHGYGGLMRVALEPPKCYTLASKGEFGWDGYAGTYMTVCPHEDMIFLCFQQLTESGTSPLTRKLRNLVFSRID